MDTQLQSLSKIFTERLFRIPDYQRGYAWTEQQLRDFWNDVVQLEDGKNHYTGVLTLEEVPGEIVSRWEDDCWIVEAKGFQALYVVDGQQRLTTAIILIQVILEQTQVKLNYTSHVEIQRKFIFDSKDDGISRSYIFGYEKDNPSYEYLKTKVFLEHSSTGGDSRDTVYTHNLEYAKRFFREQLQGLSHDDIELIYKKITQHLLFNIFTIADDVDVCVAFETMNNRGKPLSYLELLKNRLVYLSLKFREPDYERVRLRKAINECWKSIYHSLGKNKDKPLDDDKFLLNHFVIYFGQEVYGDDEVLNNWRYTRLARADYAGFLLGQKFVPKNVSPDADAKMKLELRDVYEYVNSLQISVEIWYKIFNPFDSDFEEDIQIWLDKLNRLGFESFAPITLVLFQTESATAKRLAALQAIERFGFIANLAPYTYKARFAEEYLLKLLFDQAKGKISTDKITRNLQEAANRIAGAPNLMENLQSVWRANNGFFNWKMIRYFLFEHNLMLQFKSKTKRAKIFWPEFTEDKSDFVSVEHIYPQRPQSDYWRSRFSKYNTRQRAALRHSLGNLLPLSKPKNASLQNRSFPEKVEGKGAASIGYRYGSYSENEVSKCGDWSAEEILERGLKLLDFMERRWNISLGDKATKIFLLNLGFME